MLGLFALLAWVGAALSGIRLYERLAERAGYRLLKPVWLGLPAFVLGCLGLIALMIWGMIEYPSIQQDPSGLAAEHRDLPLWLPLVSLGMLGLGTVLFALLLWRAGRRPSFDES